MRVSPFIKDPNHQKSKDSTSVINRIVGNFGNFDGFGQVIASKQLSWKVRMSSLGEDRIVRERRRYAKLVRRGFE
jgi:hypothetical protein